MAAPRNVLVDVLAITFGISSWVEISGLGVEMPLMMDTLPEGWYLGSYIVVVVQLANIGPLAYGIARRYKSHKVLEIPTIHVTLLIAFTSCLLLSAFWDYTSVVGGKNRSTALLTLAFTLALVDATSSVLYLPFMATFRDIYVISCMIGEGACGLFPSILGFIQGIGGNMDCKNTTISSADYANETTYKLVPAVPEPRFSVNIYFIFLSLMVVISWISFVLLNKLPRIQGEKVIFRGRRLSQSSITEFKEISEPSEIKSPNDQKKYFILLAIQTFICVFQNGILSSIQPFSCKPYGNTIYQLSVNLSLISNPIGCFIALFYPVMTLKSVAYVTIFNSIWGFYILVIATLSPTPPMTDTAFGGILMGASTENVLADDLSSQSSSKFLCSGDEVKADDPSHLPPSNDEVMTDDIFSRLLSPTDTVTADSTREHQFSSQQTTKKTLTSTFTEKNIHNNETVSEEICDKQSVNCSVLSGLLGLTLLLLNQGAELKKCVANTRFSPVVFATKVKEFSSTLNKQSEIMLSQCETTLMDNENEIKNRSDKVDDSPLIGKDPADRINENITRAQKLYLNACGHCMRTASAAKRKIPI